MSDELTPIENRLVDIVLEARKRHFSVQSDFARTNAVMVAMAASMGFITTKIHSNVYGPEWMTTAGGLRFLGEFELGEDDED